jgi:HK97 family phage portal protein
VTLVKRAAQTIQASINNPSIPITSSLVDGLFGIGAQTRAGTAMSETTALTLSTVWRSVNLISNLAGSLPFHAIDDNFGFQDSILERPHPAYTPSDWRRLLFIHRALYGNCYALKVRDHSGRILRLTPVHPNQVTVWWYPGDNEFPSGRAYRLTLEDGSQSDILTDYDVFHSWGFTLDGIKGISPIRQAAFESLGLTKAAEEHGSRFFGSGAQAQGFITVDQEKPLSDNDITKLKRRWRSSAGVANAYDVMVLEGAVKFEKLSIPNEDAQFLQTRSFQVEEVARWYGVPPFLLMHTQGSTSWGTGLEQQATGFNTFDLVPTWLKPFEDRCTMDLLPEKQRARYDTSQLTRGDTQARGAFYRLMREIGAFNADEVRAREYLPPIPGGDIYLQPVNLTPMGVAPDGSDPAARARALAEIVQKLYLGVDVVLTSEEARKLLADAGFPIDPTADPKEGQ